MTKKDNMLTPFLPMLEKEVERLKRIPELSKDTLEVWDKVVYSWSRDYDSWERCIVIWFTSKWVKVISLEDCLWDEDDMKNLETTEDLLVVRQVKYNRLVKVKDFI